MNQTIMNAVEQYEANGLNAAKFLRDAVDYLNQRPETKNEHKGLMTLLTDFALTVEIK